MRQSSQLKSNQENMSTYIISVHRRPFYFPFWNEVRLSVWEMNCEQKISLISVSRKVFKRRIKNSVSERKMFYANDNSIHAHSCAHISHVSQFLLLNFLFFLSTLCPYAATIDAKRSYSLRFVLRIKTHSEFSVWQFNAIKLMKLKAKDFDPWKFFL